LKSQHPLTRKQFAQEGAIMIGLSWMALAGGALAVGGVAAGALLTSAEEQPKARKESRPFSCNIRALSPGERARHNENTARLRSARVETRELQNGLRFRIAADRMDLATLGDWVALERRCCSFFGFAIEVEPDDGAVWLSLTGDEGVKDFIRLEIG
jgi:hypothetical protein